MKPRVLVVDDQNYLRDATCLMLRGWGYAVDAVASGVEAIELIKAGTNEYAVIVLDYCMPEMNGGETARRIMAINQESTIIVFSGSDNPDNILDSWDSGAVVFVRKGEDGTPEKLRAAVEANCRKFHETLQTLKHNHCISGNQKIIASIGMVGRSSALAKVSTDAINYQDKKENTLIMGSTGVGKEKVARALHTGRADTFFPVNCSNFSNNQGLMEAELFGYEKGAFTGGLSTGKAGIFECARGGGTVYLDEIHNLNLSAQKSLLRVLQEKAIRRVGGSKEYEINFRLICSGKADLFEMTERGEFLPDLYYRIDVLSIVIPELRFRKEDIEPLVLYFTEKYNLKHGEKKKFLMKTVRYLENYSWPGNVRELENAVTKLLANSKHATIDPKELPSKFFADSNSDATYVELEKKHEVEKKLLISSSLESTNWKVAPAASRLGVPLSTMYDLMNKFGISKKRPAEMIVN